MTRRALTNALTLAVPLWGIVGAFALNSGPLLILAFFALLLCAWAVEHV